MIGESAKRHCVPALVLGGGITALGVARQLGRGRVRSYVVNHRPEFLRGSRHIRGRVFPSPDPDHLTGWLAAQPLERAVLIPCSDTWLVAVASLPETLSRRFPASVPPAASARALVDKWRLAELLEGAGVPHPRTSPIRTLSDWSASDHASLDGAFLKPAHSQAFFQAFQQKGLLLEDETAAARRVEDALNRGFALMIQETIPGPADHQLCIDGFVDREGVIRGRFARRWLRKYPAHFGESSLSVSVPLAEVSEAVELADRTIALMPYRGPYSVELKKDARDGRYRVLEVNVRPWWYIGFTCRAGVDVCRMMYRDALGEPVQDVREYRVGLHSAYPELDWHAVRALPPEMRPGLFRLLHTWLTAVQPIFSWRDPGPQLLVFIARIRRRLARATTRPRPRPSNRAT